MGPLDGLKVVEFAGLGPAPMCAMLLADLGATVLRIDRTVPVELGMKRPVHLNLLNRSREEMALDLKDPAALQLAATIVDAADVLIEGFLIGEQRDPAAWARARVLIAGRFRMRTRDEWAKLLEGTDTCFAPVLSIEEAEAHPHIAARQALMRVDDAAAGAGAAVQSHPAARTTCPARCVAGGRAGESRTLAGLAEVPDIGRGGSAGGRQRHGGTALRVARPPEGHADGSGCGAVAAAAAAMTAGAMTAAAVFAAAVFAEVGAAARRRCAAAM